MARRDSEQNPTEQGNRNSETGIGNETGSEERVRGGGTDEMRGVGDEADEFDESDDLDEEDEESEEEGSF